MIVFGTQFIYMRVKSQSYKLGPKLHLVSLKSPMFPCVFLSVSHSPVFQPALSLPSSAFYSLLLVGWPSLFPHFTHIPTFIKILRDPHNFKGLPWNLFQTLKSVWQWTSPMTLPTLGYRPHHVRVMCLLPPLPVNI